ncbi:MAG: hypothetical protein PHN41_02525 [Bacteroidales bacterium]|jgi:hypothetical protein|nr:hypothetical protein [Bacteroidales bacterium]MDD4703213.1 hypothetical protein [Bacteroidales bacterium]MDX9797691.1 hypothetical protein [Bacteroidales bacterium]
MRRLITKSILVLLFIPILFWGCKEKVDDYDFNEGIPSSGLFFKAKFDDIVWQNNFLPEMIVKTEPNGVTEKMYEFIACSEDQSNPSIMNIRYRVYLRVRVNPDGTYSDYRVQFFKDKSTSVPSHFDEYMEYNSGKLNIISQTESTITAKFEGVLKRANNYNEDKDVEATIYFQEFPIHKINQN